MVARLCIPGVTYVNHTRYGAWQGIGSFDSPVQLESGRYMWCTVIIFGTLRLLLFERLLGGHVVLILMSLKTLSVVFQSIAVCLSGHKFLKQLFAVFVVQGVVFQGSGIDLRFVRRRLVADFKAGFLSSFVNRRHF